MSDEETPSAPNYAPMIDAFKEISAAASKHGEEALTWAKEQVASNKGLVDMVNKGMLETQTMFGEFGRQALEKGQGLVDDTTGYLKDVRSRFTDPNRRDADMGAAEANVGQAFDAARNASIKELEGFGVNPAAARFGGLLGAVNAQEAMAKVGAGTVAARTNEARADQANAGLMQQGNLNNQTGINLTAQGNASGTSAVQNTLANTASGYQGLGTGLGWTQPQTAALTGGTGAMNTQYQNEIDRAKVEQSSSSGLGALAGGLLGAMGKGGALASGGALAFLEDGGIVPEEGMSTGYPQGNPQGAIPMEASPSNGAVTDDVPATGPSGAIRLSGGEFVIPKDAVSWLGEKTLQDLIIKARKGKEGAQAKPTTGPAPTTPQPAIG